MRRTALIVDDNAPFRQQARLLLTSMSFEVIGEAEDAAEAIAAARRLRPDLVLLDIQLPTQDGFTVADSIRTVHPTPRVVLVSCRDATDYGSRLNAPGAYSFITKADLDAATLMALLASGDGPSTC
jgi:DNA-binding NarL/FixJ family response regulator